MTGASSICIKCKHLCAFTCATVVPSGKNNKYLISSCLYGGKGAGNRKTCRRFEMADDEKIKERFRTLGIEWGL